MKKSFILCLVFAFFSGILPSLAQAPQYNPGSVWNISMIHTKANMETEYINSLKSNWKVVLDEAKAQGLILSYKILEGASANPDDFNVMLMIESKDLASMEANRDKMEAVRKKVFPDEEAMKKINTARIDVREIYGDKMMREVIYK